MSENDDWIDKLLLAERITPVADEGFTDDVMRRLTPRATPPNWIVLVAATLGTVLAAAVSGGEVLLAALQSSLVRQHVEMIVLMPFLIIWATFAWALSESK